MVETPKPLTQTASKPQLSMRRALMASWAPTATTGPGPASPALRTCRFRSARFIEPRASNDEFAMGHFLCETSFVTGLDQLEDPGTDESLGVQGHGADMGCEDHVRQPGQGGHRALSLGLVDVERRARQAV